MKLIDRAGQRYGRLLVVEKSAEPRKWECLCDCGAKVLVTGSNLSSGSTKSCGCLATEWSSSMGANPEFVRKRAQAALAHGQKRRSGASPEYKTWLRMKSRCYRPTDKDFSRWGGRGIEVCERWRDDFAAFLEDMGQRPSPTHSIDRLDSSASYSPQNCRWASQTEQASENRRDLVSVTVDGVRFETLASACRHFGVNVTTANERIKAGISPEVAVSTPGRLSARRSAESYLRKEQR